MNISDKLWDLITNIVPVERWVLAIGNVLKFLGLAFILLVLLMVTFLLSDWGFTSDQRFFYILADFAVMFMVLLFGVVLAVLPGGALYSPYERSLNQGRRFGTKQKPLTRKEALEQPEQTETPGLPPPGSAIPSKNLPEGRQQT